MWTRPLSFILWWLLVFTGVCMTTSNLTPACPDQCLCSTTEEGLHKAVCTSLSSLQKFSFRIKHHNINIINLHGAGVVKVNDELDRFNEVVSLDLSDNKIEHLNTLLRSSKKLTHVNLSHNKFKEFSATILPQSVSSIDLTNNRLDNVPSSLETLTNLEHLLLKGNPLQCSCHNLKVLHHLHEFGVVFDDIRCINKSYRKAQSWKDFKVSDVCSDKKHEEHFNLDDMMMGDQPADTEMIGEETSDRKSMPLIDSKDLNTGETFESSGHSTDNEDEAFIDVSKKHQHADEIHDEGSGDSGVFNDNWKIGADELVNTEMTPIADVKEGSGDALHESTTLDSDLYDYEGSGDEQNITTTTGSFITGGFHRFFDPDYVTPITDEAIQTPETPNIYLGGTVSWDTIDNEPDVTTLIAVIEEPIVKDDNNDLTAVAVQISDSKDDTEDETPVAKSSVGTYVCIGILIFILVTLIGVVIMKNIIRRRKDKRTGRYQKKDVEKAGKEMVEMNKSLLGKPVAGDEVPKKLNGNYELVPTHEPTKQNGTIDSRKSVNDVPVPKINVPKEMSENPNNNVPPSSPNRGNQQQDLPDSIPQLNGSNSPQLNGHNSPQFNGRHYPDSNLLGPSTDYIPVYDADAGRVRIKLTEIPKPKTPVLITRSRSNAGDIIITPVSEPSSPAKNLT